MKRSLVTSLLASGALISVLAPVPAHAVDGVINFMGVIRAPGCDINGNTPGLGNTQTVQLGTPTPEEVGLGNAVEAEFQLNLAGGAGCTDGRKVRIMFDPANGTPAGNLALLDADRALNVEIQIRNNATGNTGIIPIGGSETTPQVATITGNPGTAELKYAAKYVEVGGAAGAGSGASSIKYLLSYN